MRRTEYRFQLKIRNGARSCATYAPGIQQHSSHLGLKLVYKLDKIAVVVLVIGMLCSEIRELLLLLQIVDGDILFLHKLRYKQAPKGDVLRLGVSMKGERPQVLQHIFLENRCQEGRVVACLSTWR